MNSKPQPPSRPEWADWNEESSGEAESGGHPEKFKALTREQAQALRKTLPTLSPWRVVAAQAVAGLVCVLIGWLFSAGGALAWSALYGAAAVVVPNALLARGMTKQGGNAVAAAAGFLVWEMLKIAAAIGFLLIAAKVVPHLSWPALLAAMVVCMKVSWFALLWRGRTRN
ncbi:MAG: ATP synthase subunit I [Paucibacter sp.]|nr:ATP synthase subunit I [Roseateles sp.]